MREFESACRLCWRSTQLYHLTSLDPLTTLHCIPLQSDTHTTCSNHLINLDIASSRQSAPLVAVPGSWRRRSPSYSSHQRPAHSSSFSASWHWFPPPVLRMPSTTPLLLQYSCAGKKEKKRLRPLDLCSSTRVMCKLGCVGVWGLECEWWEVNTSSLRMYLPWCVAKHIEDLTNLY